MNTSRILKPDQISNAHTKFHLVYPVRYILSRALTLPYELRAQATEEVTCLEQQVAI